MTAYLLESRNFAGYYLLLLRNFTKSEYERKLTLLIKDIYHGEVVSIDYKSNTFIVKVENGESIYTIEINIIGKYTNVY